jgi:hypothetical protein
MGHRSDRPRRPDPPTCGARVIRVRNIPGALVYSKRSRGIRFSSGDLPTYVVGVASWSRDGRRRFLHVHREPHDRATDAQRGVARPSGRPFVDSRSYLCSGVSHWSKKKSPTRRRGRLAKVEKASKKSRRRRSCSEEIELAGLRLPGGARQTRSEQRTSFAGVT